MSAGAHQRYASAKIKARGGRGMEEGVLLKQPIRERHRQEETVVAPFGGSAGENSAALVGP